MRGMQVKQLANSQRSFKLELMPGEHRFCVQLGLGILAMYFGFISSWRGDTARFVKNGSLAGRIKVLLV